MFFCSKVVLILKSTFRIMMIPTIYTQIKGHISIYSYCRLMFFLAIWNHARFTDGWHCPQNHLSYADCVDYTLVVTFLFDWHVLCSVVFILNRVQTFHWWCWWRSQCCCYDVIKWSPMKNLSYHTSFKGVETKMLRVAWRDVWTI